jgi:hypothetical protein
MSTRPSVGKLLILVSIPLVSAALMRFLLIPYVRTDTVLGNDLFLMLLLGVGSKLFGIAIFVLTGVWLFLLTRLIFDLIGSRKSSALKT